LYDRTSISSTISLTPYVLFQKKIIFVQIWLKTYPTLKHLQSIEEACDLFEKTFDI
jgi:hypothetical protein